MDCKLDLDVGVIAACRQAAAAIADRLAQETTGKTTVSVERSVTRFLGVDGINEFDIPLPNVLVDHVRDGGGLGRGVAYWLGNGMLQTGRGAQEIAAAVGAGELDLYGLPDRAGERDSRARRRLNAGRGWERSGGGWTSAAGCESASEAARRCATC